MSQVAPAASARMAIGVLGIALGACAPEPTLDHQGYVEGEFVNVAAPIAGQLDRLAVRRGDRIAANATLYVLEAASEAAAQRQAEEQVKVAEAQLADLKLGRRLPEQEVTRAQLVQAQVEEQRLALQFARDQAQYKAGGIPRGQLEDSRAAHDASAARVAQLRSELVVAELPSRTDQIRAQAAQVASNRAALEQATWRLDQKSVLAPRTGRIFDTLYHEGEWVAAGAPVVRMLPPENVKVRFFVPQTMVGALRIGQPVAIRCDGCGADIAATLTYVSSEAEYTPPVIYSNETRSKLVFMIEAHPTPENAPRLHPGQPVSVRLQ